MLERLREGRQLEHFVFFFHVDRDAGGAERERDGREDAFHSSTSHPVASKSFSMMWQPRTDGRPVGFKI